MAHKLHYLRNPRYEASGRAYLRSLVSRVEAGELGYLVPALPLGYPHHFSAAPSPLVFYEYQPHQHYDAHIAVRNVTVGRREGGRQGDELPAVGGM